MARAALFAFIFCLCGWARAEVWIDTGELVETMIDGTYEGPFSNFEIKRTYNSSNPEIGYFGRGWCSPFEDRLFQASQKRMVFKPCGVGKNRLFEPSKEGWVAADGSGARLEAKYNSIFLYDGSQPVRRFDSTGRLIGILNEAGQEITFQFENGKLKGASVSGVTKPIVFKTDENGRVARIEVGDRVSEYVYERDELRGVRNLWGNTYSFTYSPEHRLQRIEYPDKTFLQVKYEKSGRVAQVQRRDGCTEEIKGTSVQKLCLGKVVARRDFKGVSGPEIKRDRSGRILSFIEGKRRIDYAYKGSQRRPVQIRSTLYMRPVISKVYRYEFDMKGFVRSVELSDGSRLEATYDSRYELTALKQWRKKKQLAEIRFDQKNKRTIASIGGESSLSVAGSGVAAKRSRGAKLGAHLGPYLEWVEALKLLEEGK